MTKPALPTNPQQLCRMIRQITYRLEAMSGVYASEHAMADLMHIRAHAHSVYEFVKHFDRVQRNRRDGRTWNQREKKV